MITVPILCYHKVGTEALNGRRLNIEPERLASHVSFFSRRGYKFLLGRDFMGSLQPKCIAFTFDDAFECTLTETNIIFGRYQVPSTHYAVAEKVGKVSDWAGESPYSLANWDLLQEAHRLGHEVGNHTCRHAKLADLESPDVEREIRHAEQLLHAKGLGGSFCYPVTAATIPDLSSLSVNVVPLWECRF